MSSENTRDTFFHVSHLSLFICLLSVEVVWHKECLLLCLYTHKTVLHGRLGILHQSKYFAFSYIFLLSAQFLRKRQWRRNSEPSFQFTSGLGNFQQSCLLPYYFNGSHFLLCYASPWWLWLASTLAGLVVSRVVPALFFCFSLRSCMSQPCL